MCPTVSTELCNTLAPLKFRGRRGLVAVQRSSGRNAGNGMSCRIDVRQVRLYVKKNLLDWGRTPVAVPVDRRKRTRLLAASRSTYRNTFSHSFVAEWVRIRANDIIVGTPARTVPAVPRQFWSSRKSCRIFRRHDVILCAKYTRTKDIRTPEGSQRQKLWATPTYLSSRLTGRLHQGRPPR